MVMMTERDIQETSQLITTIQMMDREDRARLQGFLAGMRVKSGEQTADLAPA